MQRYENLHLRRLSDAETSLLEKQGCCADSWDNVSVSDKFSPTSIRNCRFKGKVTLGENVYISNIGSYIADVHISDNAYIENVGVIETIGESTFGIGTQVKVINEVGGREVPLYPDLTAQTAYVAAIFRERPRVIERINEMVEAEYIRHVKGYRSVIGDGARITGCGTLRNVFIDGNAHLEGAEMLVDCTIASKTAARTYIGPGVKIYNSIAASGAFVSNGTILNNSFVGGAVTVTSFAATDSLMFSNSHCENGELCSVFAGPFTVTHHKSTLLIAAMFSFFNAGSGTNMSNHLFKSGPVHQGVFRRGSKLGSGSYIMLPALVGPYTTVIGHHRQHPDIDNFPFSLLIESEGGSMLYPGINLGSYGTARDIVKWMKRDKREKSSPDYINFDEHNPFITQKILKAIETSSKLLMKEELDTHNYHRVKIKATMLKRGLRLYTLAKDRAIGAMLARGEERIATGYAAADKTDGTGSWLDVAGQYVSRKAIDILLDEIESGSINKLDDIRGSFEALHANYKMYAANWAK